MSGEKGSTDRTTKPTAGTDGDGRAGARERARGAEKTRTKRREGASDEKDWTSMATGDPAFFLNEPDP